jgi:hypothetical protein
MLAEDAIKAAVKNWKEKKATPGEQPQQQQQAASA